MTDHNLQHAEGASPSGRAFELEVFQAVRQALLTRQLGFDPSAAEVFHHRPYYSRDREKEIVFDVSIELVLPGASQPSILWVWECKDYNTAIPVDDVEEFHSKLEQIGADRTKGTIITRGAYQVSALNYAQAKGIGLARMLPSSQVEWILYRDRTKWKSLSRSAIELTEKALTDNAFEAENQDFYGFTGRGRTKRGLSLQSFMRLSLEEWGFGV